MPTTATQRLYPTHRYQDARAAIVWLCRAFGFEERAVYPGEGDTIAHAELEYDGSVFMLASTRDDGYPTRTVRELGGANGVIYVAVEDVDAHFARAVAAGAGIIRPPTDQDYGSRDYSARDCEGNLWSFGTYRP
jgi:uncharacterized glyoxalase superfamily protein PhnB